MKASADVAVYQTGGVNQHAIVSDGTHPKRVTTNKHGVVSQQQRAATAKQVLNNGRNSSCAKHVAANTRMLEAAKAAHTRILNAKQAEQKAAEQARSTANASLAMSQATAAPARPKKASELTLISEIRINGYESPVAGEVATDHLNVTVPTGANYSIYAYGWIDEDPDADESYDGTFVACTRYFLIVVVVANDGYAFADDCKFYANDSESLIDGPNSYVWGSDATYASIQIVPEVATEPSATEIHNVYVYGYDFPFAGDNSQEHMNFTVPTGANYQIVADSPVWWNEDEGTSFSGTFVQGTRYSAGMTLVANDGYVFADDCEFWINNYSGFVDYTWTGVDEDDNTKAYVWAKPKEALYPISEIRVNGYEPPVAGEKATDHLNLTVPSGANYGFINPDIWMYWIDYDANSDLDFTGTFVANTRYCVKMQLKANDGYGFREDCKFYINDEELSIHINTGVNSYDNTRASLQSVPKRAASPLVSNVIDFETGDLTQFSFANDTTYPWVVTSDDAAAGTYCMKSGNGGVPSSSSAITAAVNYPEDGHIIFDAKCMGEGNTPWDACTFYIDGEKQFSYGTNVEGWNTYAFEVAAGSHTFKWEYTKDESVNPTGDSFFVDNIKFGTGKPCVAPTKLTKSRNGNAVTLTWNGTSESFTLRYRVDGGSWTTVSDLTETTYTLADMESGSYEVQVQAACETDTWVSLTFDFEKLVISSTANWYGYATWNGDDEDWTHKFISFTMQDPAKVTAASDDMGGEYTYAAAYADGYMWFITTQGTTSSKGALCKAPLNNETKTIGTVEIVKENAETVTTTSMAYNPKDCKMYYIAMSSQYDGETMHLTNLYTEH